MAFSVENWPSNTVLGEIRLEVYNATSATTATITFSSVKKEDSLSLPYTLTTATWANPVMFDLWTSDGGTTVFLKSVGGPFV
jgi:hypothetical protein